MKFFEGVGHGPRNSQILVALWITIQIQDSLLWIKRILYLLLGFLYVPYRTAQWCSG